MATTIQVKCIDDTLTLTSSPVVSSGNVGDVTVTFTFCSKWDNYTSKTAIFYKNESNVYYALLDSDNVCTVPYEVLADEGNLYFGVFGCYGTSPNIKTRTSEVICYKIVKGAITTNLTPSDPSPSIYAQILARLNEVDSEIDDIQALIPTQASSSNQLADKSFVNSSITTNTATFRGTFNIVSDLGLTRDATHSQVATALATVVTTVTNNDYSFVAIPNATVSTQIDQYDRYKYTGSAWAYEFTLNNSSFTASQWNAINSGISTSGVAQIETNRQNILNKQDTLVSGTNIKSVNNQSLVGSGNLTVSAVYGQYTNISVSGTPSALSSYNSWDTEQNYGYYLDITVTGLTSYSLVMDMVVTDTILEAIAPVLTASTDTLRVYTEDATALSGTIYTLITSEIQ